MGIKSVGVKGQNVVANVISRIRLSQKKAVSLSSNNLQEKHKIQVL